MRKSFFIVPVLVLIAVGIGWFFIYKNIPQPESEKGWIKPAEFISKEPTPQAHAPFAIAITKDGKYAYVGFDLAEYVFKIRLADFTIEAAADLSEYFPTENEYMALDASEKKLFLWAKPWRKLLVLDTQNMSVIHVIDNFKSNDMFQSQHGPFILTWDAGIVKFVNTETYEVTTFAAPIGFLQIQETKHDPSKLYVVPASCLLCVSIYDYKAKAFSYNISYPPSGGSVNDFKVLPNEQKAYLATTSSWYKEGHAYGKVYSFDLIEGKVKAIPVDGGVTNLEVSPDSKWVYIGTAYPEIQTENNLLVVDTQSDTIVGTISLNRTKYNWPYNAINDLQIDPTNPNLLYATSADGNAFIKVNLNNLTLADVLVFNEESFQPRLFVRRPAQATGYILIHKSANAFELDLNSATIKNVVKFPIVRVDVYEVAINDAGRLFIAQGGNIVSVNATDMRLLATHRLPKDISALWNFVLSRDQKTLYSITQERGTEYQDIFLAIDTTNFQVKANFKLERGGFQQPYELPDRSKLYTVGGTGHLGPVVIHVISTGNYSVQKTIIFDESGSLGSTGSINFAYAYDPSSRTLFVGGTLVVLAIDTDTDTIKKVIYLKDVAKAIGFEGLQPWEMTSGNAIGLLYNPEENYLYIAHLDRSFVSIYDLNNNRFLPHAIPLKGYFPSYIFANDDYSKIYTLNWRSDSVSVIDVKSKMVEKVIDLHAYLQ